MDKLKCYYAHTMLSYGSTIEEQDIKLLESLGFEVINPNSKEIAERCSKHIEECGKDRVMELFREIVLDCDIVAFRALPDGTILSGIASELINALDANIPILELPCSVRSRMIAYPETKQMLIELGHYKIIEK